MSTPPLLLRRRETLGLVAASAVAPFLPVPGAATAAGAGLHPGPSRRDIPFNDGWRFRRGEGQGAEAVDLDDRGWRAVDLPHDWSVENIPGKDSPFDLSAEGGTATGFTVGGEGWYRKRFRLDHAPRDARVEIVFDGIYELSDVWLNGRPVGASVSGYAPFALDLTPHLNRDGQNVLAVHVRNLGKNSRWYAGSGIYREVRLDILPAAARIARWGVAMSTRRIDGGVAEIDVGARILEPDGSLQLVTRLRDAQGRVVAEAASPATDDVRQVLTTPEPRLWSPTTPTLYTLESELRRGEAIIDRLAQPCGIRIVAFDPQHGMTINGVATKLRGGCIHHDNGLLGARAYGDADERRIRLLQARGFNALRSAHNPASRSLREACDRLGMLLIDEAFDAWHVGKNPDDFSTRFPDHWQEVIRALVLSARNSPSVIMWSIGNEIPDRSSPQGLQWAWRLADAVHRADPTRPVTAAIHGTVGPPVMASPASVAPNRAGKRDNASIVFLDVLGYNYRLDAIEDEERAHPERVVYASESFPKDVFDYKDLMDRSRYFLGEFVWTAMDHLGEAGIGMSTLLKPGPPPVETALPPWTISNCGDLDLIGAQKPQSLARDVAWGISGLEVLVHRPIPQGMTEIMSPWGWPDEAPCWTWPGAEGKPLRVRAYTRGDHVECRLNGRKIGEKKIAKSDRMSGEFEVPYHPGQIEVIARLQGRVIGRRRLETVGPGARLHLAPESRVYQAGPGALSFVHVAIADAKGRLLPDAARDVSLTIDGPAELLGFGSGDPHAMASLQAPVAKTFRGRALAILRPIGPPGSVRIFAQSKGLAPASAVLRPA